MDRLFVLVLFVVISCENGSHLDISDLKFPDPERVFIRNNNVDTMYLFVPQENGTVDRYYKAYDEQGRVTFDSTWGYSVRNYYDLEGMLVKRETGFMTDSIWYELNVDSMLVNQRWSNGNMEVKFYFDDGGRVYRKIELEKDIIDQSRKTRTDYEYQEDLLKRCVIYESNSERIDIEFMYYYSPERNIDSVTLRTRNGHRQSWIYDRNGLLMAESSNGKRNEVRFVYIKRR